MHVVRKPSEAESGGSPLRAGSGRDTIAGPEVCSRLLLSDRFNEDKYKSTAGIHTSQLAIHPNQRRTSNKTGQRTHRLRLSHAQFCFNLTKPKDQEKLATDQKRTCFKLSADRTHRRKERIGFFYRGFHFLNQRRNVVFNRCQLALERRNRLRVQIMFQE